MILDFSDIRSELCYKILIGSIVPRPIAWVSSVDGKSRPNLAPFSFFTVASANPPVLCFSPGLKMHVEDGVKKGVPKDTLRNVRETQDFVVNIVSENLAVKMNQTSAEFPPDVDEFEVVGLCPAPSSLVKSPRVAEALISFECRLLQVIEFGTHPGAGNLVLGQVLCAHLDASVYFDEHVDLSVLKPIGRLAGAQYCRVNDLFELARPGFGNKALGEK